MMQKIHEMKVIKEVLSLMADTNAFLHYFL